MMKRFLIILNVLLIAVGHAHALTIAFRYDDFRYISLASSTNRFEQSIYVGGWVDSGANVVRWTKDLTLEKLLASCGGKKMRKGDIPDEWVYTVSVYRPTESAPNPRTPFVSIVMCEQNRSLAVTKVEPEDAVLVSRQKMNSPTR